ncbi:MAG: hypothetical protein WC861_01135 [Candidatus Micrarchaeia archaeon]|jgi:hypothetical protein
MSLDAAQSIILLAALFALCLFLDGILGAMASLLGKLRASLPKGDGQAIEKIKKLVSGIT